MLQLTKPNFRVTSRTAHHKSPVHTQCSSSLSNGHTNGFPTTSSNGSTTTLAQTPSLSENNLATADAGTLLQEYVQLESMEQMSTSPYTSLR
jgi:hypothetical protein